MSTPHQNSKDEKFAPAVKVNKPGVVSVAAEEAARLDRRIAEKRGEGQLQSFEAHVMAKEPRGGEAPSVPGVVSGSAFEQVVVKNKVAAATTLPVPESPQGGKKDLVEDDSLMIKKGGNEVAMEDAAVAKKEEMAPVVVQEKEAPDAKENVVPHTETMPAVSPVVTTTADHGVVQEPDVEYGVYEPNEDGLAVAVAVTEDDDDVFIPSAVEYDPDAKPPLHRNRRFRLYGFLAFFALVACAVGATVGIVLSSSDDSVKVHPRERLGIRELVERVVGEEKLSTYQSPYSKALDWIIYKDPAEPIPEDRNFIQRYILAYFAFAMTGQKKWKSCSPQNVTRNDLETCVWEELASTDPIVVVTEPKYRWLSSAHECEWAGTRCDTDRQIRAIEFGGQDLEGTFPEGIAHLPFLQSFEIARNDIRGTIPTEIATMNHLVNIEVSFNKLTGTIPDEIYGMKSMIRFNFENNKLSGTISTRIAQMRDLKGLFLSHNDFNGSIPTEIGSLQSMTYLRLSENRFNGKFPSEIGNLRAMKKLWVSDNDLSGEIPPEINAFKDLQDVRLRRNPRLGGHFSQEFWSNNRWLGWFDIRGCNFTGSLGPGLGGMRDLRFFRIAGNHFNGTVPGELANLKFLESMWIQDNDITGTMPEVICRAQGTGLFSDLHADCRGDEPEIDCPCCTGCCFADGTGCGRVET